MNGQKAIVKTAKLYHDNWASAVLEDDPTSEQGKIIGWVLNHDNPETWKQKLELYDEIEDVNDPDDPESYQRCVTSAYLLEETILIGSGEEEGDGGGKKEK